jgi:toxin CcdB
MNSTPGSARSRTSTQRSERVAQFDVHRNKGSQKDSIPFVVVIQSARFDAYRRRVVAPLVLRQHAPDASVSGSRMNPVFRIGGVEVVLNPLQVVSVAIDQLGVVVDSLAHHGQRIADAMDELTTRAWG